MDSFLLQSIQNSYIALLAISLLPSNCCGCFITDCFNAPYKKHSNSEDATGDNNAVTQTNNTSTYPPTPLAEELQIFKTLKKVLIRKNFLLRPIKVISMFYIVYS